MFCSAELRPGGVVTVCVLCCVAQRLATGQGVKESCALSLGLAIETPESRLFLPEKIPIMVSRRQWNFTCLNAHVFSVLWTLV